MNNSDDFMLPRRAAVGWDANQTVPELRPPRPSGSASQPPEEQASASQTCSDSSCGSGESAPKPIKHRLSADAKEFVPRSAQIAPSFVPPETSYTSSYNETTQSSSEGHTSLPRAAYYPRSKSSVQDRLAKYQMANGTDSNSETSSDSKYSYQDQSDDALVVVKRLHEFMQEITMKPGRFDALGRMFVEESASWLGESHVVSPVVDAIISQAIVERNFQYNGARLCSLLGSECDYKGHSVFNQHLLERVQREYEELLPFVESQPSRVLGFVGLLAELYTQMRNTGGLHILGQFLLNILDTLVTVPTVDNIKRVCQYLKLTGRLLDADNLPKVDALMDKLQLAGYPTNTFHIVSSVITLRAEKWGDESGSIVSNTSSADLFPVPGQPCLQSEAVQYGPDGLVLTKEESEFLHESSKSVDGGQGESEEIDDFGDEYEPYEDEMDEEIEEGYIEFLLETKQI